MPVLIDTETHTTLVRSLGLFLPILALAATLIAKEHLTANEKVAALLSFFWGIGSLFLLNAFAIH